MINIRKKGLNAFFKLQIKNFLILIILEKYYTCNFLKTLYKQLILFPFVV